MVLLAAAPLPSDACSSVAACTLFVNRATGPRIESTSTNGNGIVGRTTASGNPNAFNAGVYGESLATGAEGLQGFSASATPSAMGLESQVKVRSVSFGLGVRYGVAGIASHSSGKNAGVEGLGPTWVIGLGEGPDPGVFGSGEGSGSEKYGVEGISASLAGVHGQGPIGISRLQLIELRSNWSRRIRRSP